MTVRTYREGDRACVVVSDTEVRISEENLTRIFDPFFTTKEGGSGVGLSAVRTIATAHGGAVEAESMEGAGSTFVLSFPMPERDARVQEQPEQAAYQGTLVGGLSVRHPGSRRRAASKGALKNILDQQGHRVVAMEDSIEALRAFGEGDYDVMFLDLGMPRMNGY